MQRYSGYYAEDFVFDADFQRWVRDARAQDEAIWREYLWANPEKTREVETARTILQSIYLPDGASMTDREVQELLNGLLGKIKAENELSQQVEPVIGPESRPLWQIWWLSAASVLVICAIGWWYALRNTPKGATIVQATNSSLIKRENSGLSEQIYTLEDGSKITLSPGSVIEIPAHFERDFRQVRLSGKALFSVAKNPERPFLVYTDELVTRVLGTTFTVNSTDKSSESTVEVIEGKVSVYRQQDFVLKANGANGFSKGVVLTANQKAVFLRDQRVLTRALVEAPKVVKTGKPIPAFIYRNTPVSDVLADVERAYQVDIIFDRDQLSDCPITAALSNQTLLEKVQIICEAVEASYEVLDGQIVIYGKKCPE